MTFFKVDDGIWGHPKFALLSNDAVTLWVMAGSWSGRYMTDGFVPNQNLGLLRGSKQAAQELVDCGLWDVTLDGYLFHDWSDYQYTKAEVEARREKERNKKRQQRTEQHVVPTASLGVSLGDNPGESQECPGEGEGEGKGRTGKSSSVQFDDFWASARKASPRSDKTPAAKSYAAAMKVISHDDLMAAVAAQIVEWDKEGTEPKYRAHWATWLNQRRWERFAEAVEKAKPREVDPSAKCVMCDSWIKGKSQHFCIGNTLVVHEEQS